MAKVKVIFDRKTCVGTGSCWAVAPKYWQAADDGKAKLLKSKENKETGKYELEIEVDEDENDFSDLKVAADSCPVRAIELLEQK